MLLIIKVASVSPNLDFFLPKATQVVLQKNDHDFQLMQELPETSK